MIRFYKAIIFLLINSGIAASSLSAQTVLKVFIDMDERVWAPIAYLSLIQDFTEMYTMSYEIIIARAPIDSTGGFSFDSSILPEEDHLYRVHFSKVDDPPASLIIGSMEENHFFLIANRESPIEVKIGEGDKLINDISFSGFPPNESLQEINLITSYLDTLDYYSTNVNREFISQAVKEKLRSYADTCSHPLVSLYALYKTSFESDYKINPDFYKKYLRKWKKEDSEYFRVFKRQINMEESSGSILNILMVVLILALPIVLFLLRRKMKTKSTFSSLTVQERRIFSFLRQGITNKEIADELGISLSTVKSHVNNIFSKLKVSSRKEVMDYKE